MTPQQRFDEITARALELSRQLEERSRLYQLMGATEISQEFARLNSAEVRPIIALASSEDKP